MQNTITFNPIPDMKKIQSTKVSLETIPLGTRTSNSTSASGEATSSGNRLRRLFTGVLLVVLGALLWTVFAHVTGLNDQQVGADLSPDAPREIYIVQSGDTLWSISMGIDNDGDPRDTVDRLAALNGGSSLYIGQELILSN